MKWGEPNSQTLHNQNKYQKEENMNCYVHPSVNAVGTCVNCGRGVCEQCATVVNGKLYCKDCASSGAPLLQTKKTNGLSIASMITGIVSIPLSFCYGAGLPFGIAAFIMGLIARKQIKETPQEGNGMALTGIITGGIVSILAVFAIITIAVLLILGPVIGNVFSKIGSSLSY